MKKLILLFISMVFVISVFAQTDSYELTSKEWTKTIDDPMGSGTGDTLAGATAVYIVLDLKKPQGQPYNYNHYVYLDSLGDGTNVAVTLQGSNDNSNWHNIGSAQTWAVSDGDTTLSFSNLSAVQSISSTIASYEILHTGSAYKSGVSDTVGSYIDYGDTTNFSDTNTIGAQTITTTITEGSVAWNYQRFYLLGAGASAGTDIDKIEWNFMKPKNE
jgi:hypothetical protein